MSELEENKILKTWQKNAEVWTLAIKNEEIESRKLITNSAIINSITDYKPNNALDIGCGEGWLTRALVERGIDATGVDAIYELIENAKKLGRGKFEVSSYENIANGNIKLKNFDAVICNFSLLGKESVEKLIKVVPQLLNKEGYFFIQTLHPAFASGDNFYKDGWRDGTWDGFNSNFTDPAPWYFRTIESWIKLFKESGLKIIECGEPIHPKTNKPASIIFVGEKIFK